MEWYPLRLTTPFRTYISGGRAIVDTLGKKGLPAWRVAETWEVSDYHGAPATVRNGALGGRSLRDVTLEYPEELMGRGWRGDEFPLLAKFIDGAGMLPVHLHADDEAAQRLENQPHGKTEAWHILAAGTGATALVGLKHGVDEATLRDALLRQDYDAVMRRLPVRAGETIHVPGGTLHAFGPDTLLYEIQQTSDVVQSAMPFDMRDGRALDTDEWHRNIDMLLAEIRMDSRPTFTPGLRIDAGNDVHRTICAASPYFALERWRVGNMAPARDEFGTALALTNVGLPVTVTSGSWSETLDRAESLLLPASLGHVEITGPGDLLVAYLPDLEQDIVQPLTAAGYSRDIISTLGEV
jgi:mannose-6-phosphate isomerase